MTITIPIPEKVSLNKIYAGVHWAIRKRWKDAYYLAVLSVRPKPYLGPFPVHITYQFTLKGRGLDSLNVSFMGKCLEDSLVACNVLPDDCEKYVRSSTLETTKGKVDEVTITITPC